MWTTVTPLTTRMTRTITTRTICTSEHSSAPSVFLVFITCYTTLGSSRSRVCHLIFTPCMCRRPWFSSTSPLTSTYIHDRFIRDTWFRKSMLEMDRTEEVIREMDRKKGEKKVKKRVKKRVKKEEKKGEKGRTREKKGEKGRTRENKGEKREKKGKKGKRKKRKNRFIRDLWFRKTMIELGPLWRSNPWDGQICERRSHPYCHRRRNWCIPWQLVDPFELCRFPIRCQWGIDPHVKQALSTLHDLKKAEDEAYYHNWSQSSSSSWWQWQTSWWHPSFETSPRRWTWHWSNRETWEVSETSIYVWHESHKEFDAELQWSFR